MKSAKRMYLVVLFVLMVGVSSVVSHSSGTDALGCHYVWVNGVRVGYHCH